MIVAFLIYFGLPWLNWERNAGPDQAILFDLSDRKFYLFDWVIQPEQIFWLTGFLVIAALLLFFVTGLAGRVFCGFFCFQTIWTDLYIQIERWVQGNQRARLRLDQQYWTVEKICKKTLTWMLYLLIGFYTGLTFTLYWGEADILLGQFLAGNAPRPMYVTVLFLTSSTVVMAGFVREAVCMHMCPYSRFQSVMMDRNTRIVSYQARRGERGRHRPAKEYKKPSDRMIAGVGDCIDCNYCVQVCPTGIDIRNGLQAGCIQCGLCIDACNQIMDHLNWPQGLIRFSSKNLDQGQSSQLLSLKTAGYGAVLILSVGLLAYAMASRPILETSIHQIRNPLFLEQVDGRIQNRYDLKLKNQTDQAQSWRISILGLSDADLDIGRIETVEIPPFQSITVRAQVNRIRFLKPSESAVETFRFIVSPLVETERLRPVTIKAGFYTPRNQPK